MLLLDDEPDRPAPFVWALENLLAGNEVNVITVDPDTERWAKVALQRMLDLPGA